jgi:DNA replication protein DnaC
VGAQVSEKRRHLTGFEALRQPAGAAAYERRSVAIASHSPFDAWGRFLPDQPTAVSLLDRLCHHAHIITTSGDSYRLTHRTTGGIA